MLARWLLRQPRTKHFMRTLYSLQSVWKLKRAAGQGLSYRDIYQAGKSVAGIDSVRPVADIVAEFAAVLRQES
jgi:nitronate monooxygenase